jgi:hypothetical protein
MAGPLGSATGERGLGSRYASLTVSSVAVQEGVSPPGNCVAPSRPNTGNPRCAAGRAQHNHPRDITRRSGYRGFLVDNDGVARPEDSGCPDRTRPLDPQRPPWELPFPAPCRAQNPLSWGAFRVPPASVDPASGPPSLAWPQGRYPLRYASRYQSQRRAPEVLRAKCRAIRCPERKEPC